MYTHNEWYSKVDRKGRRPISMRHFPELLKRLARHNQGATAVEFALLSPILLMMLAGIVTYGGYFWTSHAIQQLTNDAARASVAGITAAERKTLAQTMVTTEIGDYSFLKPAMVTVSVVEQTNVYVVQVSYNGADSPFALGGLVPGPPATIVRQAAVARGGY